MELGLRRHVRAAARERFRVHQAGMGRREMGGNPPFNRHQHALLLRPPVVSGEFHTTDCASGMQGINALIYTFN